MISRKRIAALLVSLTIALPGNAFLIPMTGATAATTTLVNKVPMIDPNITALVSAGLIGDTVRFKATGLTGPISVKFSGSSAVSANAVVGLVDTYEVIVPPLTITGPVTITDSSPTPKIVNSLVNFQVWKSRSEPYVMPTGHLNITYNDLQYILDQIKMGEAHSKRTATSLFGLGVDQSSTSIKYPYNVTRADRCLIADDVASAATTAFGATGLSGSYLWTAEDPLGVRTVNGECNNISSVMAEASGATQPLAGDTAGWGSAEKTFTRLSPQANTPSTSVALTDAQKLYQVPTANVTDPSPRIISNLISDQSLNNPAAIAAGYEASSILYGAQSYGTEIAINATTGDTSTILSIPNITADYNVSAGYNSWFTLFGQFFDHGLDLVPKAGAAVLIPLQPDDPLYVASPSAPNMMVLTRAADAAGQSTNETTPWIDQSQTYGSHPSQNVFMREYSFSETIVRSVTNLSAKSTGGLLESSDHGLPTWKDIKSQALKLGILLTDYDAKSVPVIATDQYGKFIPGSNGYPLVLFSSGANYKWVQGSKAGLATNIGGASNTWVAVPTGHAFINDTTASAVPYAGSRCGKVKLLPDLDSVINSALSSPDCTYYDDETLNIHLVAGDGRVNENIGLSAIHNVFHSEHNLVVQDIKDMLNNNPAIPAAFKGEFINSTNGGDRLYQAARFVMEMEYQHMAYDEFIRRLAPELPLFISYDSTHNAAVTAEFASAVYRLGHSMLNETIARSNPGEFYDPTNNQDVALIGAFTNPAQARLVRPAFIASASYSGGVFTYSMSGSEKAPLTGQIVTIANMGNTDFNVKDAVVASSSGSSFTISKNYKASVAAASNVIAPTAGVTRAISKTADCSTTAPVVCTNYATVTISDPGTNGYSYTPAEAAASVAQGMSTQRGNEIDEFVTDAVRNNLLGLPLDLASLNITRGRDVGLPTLNQFRAQNTPKLQPYLTWADFIENGLRHTESGSNFIAAYGTHPSVLAATTVADKRAAGIAITTAGLVVNIIDAVSNGSTITFTGLNTYSPGQVVTISGISGPANVCNLSNVTVTASDIASFTVASPVSCAGYRQPNSVQPGSGGYAEFVGNGTSLALAPPVDAKDFYNSTGNWNVNNNGLNNIDLWMGGLAEKPAKQPILAPMLGTTFQYIFTEQMQRLQDNDRFYYLSRLVGMNLFGEIPAQKFTDIVRRNTPSASSGNLTANRGIVGMNNPGFAISDCAASTNSALVQGIMTCAGMKTDKNLLLSHKGLDNVTIFAAPASAVRAAIAGGDGDDSIQGGPGDDWLSGGPSGGDLIDGAAGNDIILGGFGEDLLKGGAGDDVINAGSSQIGDIADGGSGNDFIHCGECAGVAASFIGEAGNDFIQGGKNADLKLDGGEGDDWIEGGAGWDIIDGDNGPLLNILINLPVLYGGNDVINGGSGQDVMFGDGGDDIFNLGSGPGFPDGTYGFDWANYEYNIRYDNSTALRPNVWADLSGALVNPNTARSNDTLVNIEGLSGSSGNDQLFGGTGTADITVTANGTRLGRAGQITLTLPGILNIAGGSIVTGVGIAPNAVVLALVTTVFGGNTTVQLSAPNVADVPGPIQISTAPLEVPSLITGLSEIVTGTPGTVKYTATDPLSTKWSGGGIIFGGEGNDTVYPSSGADILHGSAYLHTCIGITKSPVPAQVLAATDVVCGTGRGFSTMTLLAPFMDAGVLNPGELRIVREILPTSARVTGLLATGTSVTYTADHHFFVGEQISIVGLRSTSVSNLAAYGTRNAVITGVTSTTFTISKNAPAQSQLNDLTSGTAVGTDVLDLSGGATLAIGTPGTVAGGGISGPSTQFTFTAITGALPAGASFGCRMTDSVSGAVVVLYDFQRIKFTNGNEENISYNCGGMDVPDAPAAPTATGGAGTATISWTPPASNGSAIDYYSIEVSKGFIFFPTVVTPIIGSCSGQVAANLTSCNVTGLAAGNYRFRITAHNAVGLSGKSQYSNSAIVTTFVASKIRPSLGTFTVPAKVLGDAVFALTAPSVTPAIPGTFTYTSATPSVLAISTGDSATVGIVGTSLITALFTPSDLTTYDTATITATATVTTVAVPPVVVPPVVGGGGGLQIVLSPQGTTFPAGSVVRLSTTGGSIARVLFSTRTVGCRIIGTDLTATAAASCLITASQGAATASANVVFTLSTQSALRISNKTNTLKVGRTLILTSVGGTSSGAVSYSVTGPCTIANSDEITGNAAGDCVVTATKAGTSMYAPVTSAPFTLTVK